MQGFLPPAYFVSSQAKQGAYLPHRSAYEICLRYVCLSDSETQQDTPAATEEEPCFGSWITDCNSHQHKNKQLQTAVLGTWLNSMKRFHKERLKNSQGLFSIPFISSSSHVGLIGQWEASFLVEVGDLETLFYIPKS